MAHALTYRSRSLRRGFGLLDVGLSLAVGMIGIAGYLQFESDTADTLKATGAADFMTQVSSAASEYLRSNTTTLSTAMNDGQVTVIPVTGTSTVDGLPSLQASGLLPSSFINTDGFGQSASLLVRRVAASGSAPDHLEALVTTIGGRTMTDRELGLSMSKIGGAGGAMYVKPPAGVAAANITGAYGTWSSPAAEWAAGGVSPTAGHLMTNISNLTAASAPWLNRYNTGNPDDNRMHTSVDVYNNNLNNIANTDTETVSNSRGSSVQVNSKLNVSNGGEACTGNATGCGWAISDDGGFYDQNDGWITMKVNPAATTAGLKLAGTNNNLSVGGSALVAGTSEFGGTAYADNGIEIRAGLLQVDGSKGIQWGSYGNAGLEMTDDNWIRAYGGSAFKGISANIVQAAEFQDMNNPAYYVEPSQNSYLNQLTAVDEQITGNLYVNNTTTTYDLDVNHNLQFSGGLYSPNLDVNIDGTTGNAGFQGDVTIGQQAQLGATATDNAACSPNGSIAANSDGSGRLMSCINGIWAPTASTAKLSYYNLPDTPGVYNGDATAMNLGAHFFCALTETFEISTSDPNSKPNATRVLPSGTDSSTGYTIWSLSRGDEGGYGGAAACIDY